MHTQFALLATSSYSVETRPFSRNKQRLNQQKFVEAFQAAMRYRNAPFKKGEEVLRVYVEIQDNLCASFKKENKKSLLIIFKKYLKIREVREEGEKIKIFIALLEELRSLEDSKERIAKALFIFLNLLFFQSEYSFFYPEKFQDLVSLPKEELDAFFCEGQKRFEELFGDSQIFVNHIKVENKSLRTEKKTFSLTCYATTLLIIGISLSFFSQCFFNKKENL